MQHVMPSFVGSPTRTRRRNDKGTMIVGVRIKMEDSRDNVVAVAACVKGVDSRLEHGMVAHSDVGCNKGNVCNLSGRVGMGFRVSGEHG